MSTLKTDAIEAATGTNTNLALTGKGTGKVALGDAALLVPDADGAAGQILTTDGSLALTFAATPGTSGNVLTSNGSAWTSAAAAGGGSWSRTAGFDFADTAASDFTFTGLDGSSDRIYCMICAGFNSSIGNYNLTMQGGTSGGIITTTVYSYHVSALADDSTSYGTAVSDTNDTSFKMNGTEIFASGSGAAGYCCTLYIYFREATTFVACAGNHTFTSSGGRTYGGPMIYGLLSDSTIDRIKVTCSREMDQGSATLYTISET